MLAAARKHERVVQVGTQRRSTPHLIEARDRIIREGKLGKIGLVEIYCYYHMRNNVESARHRPRPITSTTRCGPARRRCGPTTRSSIRAAGGRSWSTATASWATCASTCSTWSAGCSTWAGPRRISSSGGILVNKESQGQHLRHADRHVRFRRPASRLAASHLGRRARPEISLGRDVLRRQGHAEGERHELRLHPRSAGASRSTRDVDVRAGRISRGQDREGPGAATSPRRSAAT